MQKQENDIVLVTNLRNLFKQNKPVVKDQLGVYHYTWSCDTLSMTNTGMKYDVYVKLQAKVIYDGLVEVEVISVTINDSASPEVNKIINSGLPKYVNPKMIKWEIL